MKLTFSVNTFVVVGALFSFVVSSFAHAQSPRDWAIYGSNVPAVPGDGEIPLSGSVSYLSMDLQGIPRTREERIASAIILRRESWHK